MREACKKNIRHGQLISGVWRRSKCFSTLTVKALLIILPKHSLIESRQCNGKQKKRKQHEDAAKNHENKSLMGPLESLGAPGKYPLLVMRSDDLYNWLMYVSKKLGSNLVPVQHHKWYHLTTTQFPLFPSPFYSTSFSLPSLLSSLLAPFFIFTIPFPLTGIGRWRWRLWKLCGAQCSWWNCCLCLIHLHTGLDLKVRKYTTLFICLSSILWPQWAAQVH